LVRNIWGKLRKTTLILHTFEVLSGLLATNVSYGAGQNVDVSNISGRTAIMAPAVVAWLFTVETRFSLTTVRE